MAEDEVTAGGTHHYVIEIAVKEVRPQVTTAAKYNQTETTPKQIWTRAKLVSTADTLDQAVTKAQKLLEIEKGGS